MKTTLIANFKGGVGKTAVTTLLAQHLRCTGRRVLVLDLDHQGNATQVLEKSGHAVSVAAAVDVFRHGAGLALPAPDPGRIALLAASPALLGLERDAARHNAQAAQVRAFLASVAAGFDVCLVDTNPNPDIRYLAVAVSADRVLSPIQFNQEAIDGIAALFRLPRVGLRAIRAALNPRLEFAGLFPQLVEATPFQRANFAQVVREHGAMLVWLDRAAGRFAAIPKRSVIAEC